MIFIALPKGKITPSSSLPSFLVRVQRTTVVYYNGDNLENNMKDADASELKNGAYLQNIFMKSYPTPTIPGKR